jgi:hypothetical protein
MGERQVMEFKLDDPYEHCDHVIGGCWGHKIEVRNDSDFDGNVDFFFDIHGWLPPHNRIEPGHYIMREYNQSWRRFKVTDISWCNDPADMFFGKMVIVQSWRKANGDVEYNRDEDNTAQSAAETSFVTPVHRICLGD